MSKKKLLTMVLALVLIGAVGVGATLAYFTDKDSEKNTITMGHVEIDLDEPKFDQDDSSDDNTVTDIVPGEVITKDPTITVKEGSEDAYVRATIVLSDNLTEDQAKELIDGITILPGWYYSNPEQNGDGYYYYNQRLAAGGKAVLFEEVKIPAKWGNEAAKMTFTIDVNAEAIQADGFTPQTNDDGYITAWTYEDGSAIEADTYGEE